MVKCLTSARFNMKADILRQGHLVSEVVDESNTQGEWVLQQDEDSGEIVRSWQPNDKTTGPVEDSVLESFNCMARAIVDGGIRVAGTTERFGDMYEGIDYVRIQFLSSVRIGRRDRITNIRGPRGNVIWLEEERADLAPTIFSVTGVAEIVDPFGNHTESMALLERVETQ